MGSIPTALQIRNHPEGFNLTTSIVSDTWINDERDNSIIPMVEAFTGSLSAEDEITKYLSGNGGQTLILPHRNINSLESIKLVQSTDILGTIPITSVELISGEGILKSKRLLSEGFYFVLFPRGNKNIKVVYKIGGTVADDIEMAIKKLTCVGIFDMLEGRTGGGALTVQGFSRQYGEKGKYHNVRSRFSLQARVILNRYKTGIVGS